MNFRAQQHDFTYTCKNCGHDQEDAVEGDDPHWQWDGDGYAYEGLIDVECPDCGWKGMVRYQ